MCDVFLSGLFLTDTPKIHCFVMDNGVSQTFCSISSKVDKEDGRNDGYDRSFFIPGVVPVPICAMI